MKIVILLLFLAAAATVDCASRKRRNWLSDWFVGEEPQAEFMNNAKVYPGFKEFVGSEALIGFPDGREFLVDRYHVLRDNVNPDNGRRYYFFDNGDILMIANGEY